MTEKKPVWTKTDTHEWVLDIGEDCIEISRSRPTRWHANGVGAEQLVWDHDKPFQWDVICTVGECNFFEEEIPEGTPVREAKKIAEKILREKISKAQTEG